ncbi:MAG: TolC family protein [Planctomyces sp.]|nr:TolC family protein [Planctomyces sp.]
MAAVVAGPLVGQEEPRWIFPEQRRVEVRPPERLPHAAIPYSARPRTVSDQQNSVEAWQLSLDDAIRVALANARVVRVLAGVTAVSTGSTIYDPAIANTTIDEARSRFDPLLTIDNVFNRAETPIGAFDPIDPDRAVIRGLRDDSYLFSTGVSQQNVTGGVGALTFNSATSRQRPGDFPLNPQTRSDVDLSYTQPLLSGHGVAANLAPIVIARISTERSFFQFKDSTQELVRSVIEGYWNLVYARTDRWARQQQVEQARFAFERATARKQADLADSAEVAQTRVAYANFRATLIAAEANVFDREAALRNVMGLPPNDERELVPISLPQTDRFGADWEQLVLLAEERRPDIIELKLILEADRQQLIIARNQSQPRLDAVARYRWNGLDGLMPNNSLISTSAGAYTDWTLGVNFSVPLGLRAARAGVRRQELLIARDQANLNQGVHAAVHDLATVLRQQANAFEQYLAYQETRGAASTNLEQQFAEYRSGRVNFILVVQAIADWGNAVSSEAQALMQYNISLASLERESGTILETHGITFLEERFGAVGPKAIFGGRVDPHTECYPAAERPTSNFPRYADGEQPSEDSFDLTTPYNLRSDPGATP